MIAQLAPVVEVCGSTNDDAIIRNESLDEEKKGLMSLRQAQKMNKSIHTLE